MLSSLKTLANKLKGKPSKTDQPVKDSRIFQRFDLSHSKLFEACLPDGTTAPILNLSFGGMSLKTTADGEDELPIVIRVLGREFESKIGITHRGADFIGSRFEKKEPALLAFLQPLLGSLQQGLSLRRIDSASLKSSTQETFESVYRGEGPTDLLIAHHKAPLDRLNFTFRKDKEYLEIAIHKGEIFTSRTIDDQGRSARMVRDAEPDPKTIEQGILILTGALTDSELQNLLPPVITHLRKHI